MRVPKIPENKILSHIYPKDPSTHTKLYAHNFLKTTGKMQSGSDNFWKKFSEMITSMTKVDLHISYHWSLSITPENIRQPLLSDVFRGSRKRPVAWNGLKAVNMLFWYKGKISKSNGRSTSSWKPRRWMRLDHIPFAEGYKYQFPAETTHKIHQQQQRHLGSPKPF